MLMLSQNAPTGQYNQTGPMAGDKNPDSPSVSAQYSRNWSKHLQDPQPGSQWLLKRGNTGEWVRFVQGDGMKWCGWNHKGDCNDPSGCQDEGGNCRNDVKDQGYTKGALYDAKGNDLKKQYMNGCALGGGCRNANAHGVGFTSTWMH